MEFPNRLATALGVPDLDDATIESVLDLAREVAHGTERMYAPVSAFVVGYYVAGRVAAGADPNHAVEAALRAARDVLSIEA